MSTRFNSRHVIIRHPTSQGAIIAKISGGSRCLVPDEIANHAELVIQSVPDASGLTEHEIDYDAIEDLPEELKDTLQKHGYYVPEQ